MMLEISEEKMLNDCKKGSRTAQRQLFDRYSRRFLAVCQRYISNNFEAEDVLMDSFMKIFQSISQFRSDGSFEGWMRRIVVTEALQHLRRNRHFVSVSYSKDELLDIEMEMPIPDLEQAELMEMVKSLPEGYRAVFNLYAIEGYSHKEIAEMLGITVSTSKSQLSRARLQLQKNLTIQESVAKVVRI